MFAHRAAILILLTARLAGCAQPATPDIPSGNVISAEFPDFVLTDTPGPPLTATPGPSPTPTLPDVPPVSCSGTFAYVMTVNGVAELHVVLGCNAYSLSLPDDAGPALDNGAVCKPNAQPASLQWSSNGTRLLYVTATFGPGRGEIHVLNTNTGRVAALTPSGALLDAATGKIVKAGCSDPAACHPGQVAGGQVTFVDSANPTWSSDGTQIAFNTLDPARSAPGHFIMNADGSGIRALADPDAAALAQTWAQNAPPEHNPPKLTYQVSDPAVTVGCVTWHP